MTGAAEKSEKRPDEYALKSITTTDAQTPVWYSGISGAYSGGTHIGKAVGQSFTYTANSLNI